MGAVALFSAQTQDLSPGTESSASTSVIRFALGVLLLFLAYRQWTRRPKPGHQPTMPKWLHSVDSLTPIRALGLALLLSAVNPKNLTLTLAASLAIAQSTIGSVQSVVALALFVVIASVSVAAPVILFLVLGPRAAHTLDELRIWLTENNATVLFVLLLIFGAILIAEGVNGII